MFPRGTPRAIVYVAPDPLQPLRELARHTTDQATTCVQDTAPGAIEISTAKTALRDALLFASLRHNSEVDLRYLQCAMSRGLPDEVALHAAAVAQQRERRIWEARRAAQDSVTGGDPIFTAAALHAGQQGALYGYTTGQLVATLQAQRYVQQQVGVQAALLDTMTGRGQDTAGTAAAIITARGPPANDLLLQMQVVSFL